MAGVDLVDGGAVLRARWADGEAARFHAEWLRDCALDPETRSAANGQRLITVLDVAPQTRVTHARIDQDRLVVGLDPPGREFVFPGAWLREHRYDIPRPSEPGRVAPGVATWDCTLGDALPTETFPRARDDRRALARWLAGFRERGVALMHEVPARSGALLDVVGLFGFVRETNYGRWFEVRAEVDPVNLAYTNLGLQAHTDNPYRDPVPTLQLLACLENSVEGGESSVVDGFHVVRTLRAEAPEHLELLARHPARFEYAGSPGVRLRARRPMVELGPDGELLAVRFNSRSTAPLIDVPFDQMRAYYAAYRHFSEIVERPSSQVSFRLEPGSLFMVDNTRVLHARRAFAGAGRRWLQGCYADRDGLLSTLATLEEDVG
ncbi:MAG: TauD/TfdA family dioxygenase [Ectothiorhodospiraceae bacterium]|nr:TauD/TfdA family dioxygenase [Chromatiales bacterium]MCP5155988.1 TauD/TfdA family dioxygenase [Ectothiorhodospiraceae bacterium]